MRITALAPTRLSLFGGGTDLPIYSNQYGGMVVSVAINLRQKVVFEDEKGKYEYPDKASPDFYEKFFKSFNYYPGKAKFSFDALIESGLGSSASAAVALIGAIDKAQGLNMTRRNIAEKAWDIEVNGCRLYGGKQDQYAAAIGGMNAMWFNPNGDIFVKSLRTKEVDLLLNNILLFYTGGNRESSDIQEELKKPKHSQINALHRIKGHARMALKYLSYGNISRLGCLLDEAWQDKKLSNPRVTNKRIDCIYESARDAGALGGKIMGSGGGGYCFFLVEPHRQPHVKDALTDIGCTWVDFGIDKNGLEVRCEP